MFGSLGSLGSSGSAGTVVVTTPTPPWVLPGATNVINMLPFGNTFSNAAWVKTNIGDATFATTTTAPDGISLAVKLTASAVTANHGIQLSIIKTAVANKYRMVVTAAAAELTRIVLGFAQGTNFGTSAGYAGFDLAGGQVANGPATFGSGGWVTGAATITNVGTVGGKTFYRCQLDVTSSTATTMLPLIFLDFGSGTAAQSTSGLGTGTNGVWIWQANVLPTGAWSLATLKFNDDFNSISTIDLGNTKVPGFNWYLGGPWPSCPDTAWNSAAPAQAADFSVAGSILTIAQDRSGFGTSLCTAAPLGAGAWVGTTFQAPCLLEYSHSFNVATATAITIAPVGFMFSAEFLVGSVANGAVFPEIDIMELDGTGAGTVHDNESFHDWTVSGTTATANTNNMFIATGATYGNQNRWSRLVLSQSSTGAGHGLMHTYVNGIYLSGSEVNFGAAIGATPAATPVNAIGIYTDVETQHSIFMLGGGSATNATPGTVWPGNFDYVRVYTVN